MSPEVVLDQVDVVVSVCSDNFSIVKAQLHYLLEQGYPHYIDKFDQVSDPAIALNGSTIRPDRIDDLLGQYAGDVIDLNAAANT